MSHHNGRRRPLRFAPPHVLYQRAAALRVRAEQLAWERRSRRVLRVGLDVAQGVEKIADDQVEERST